MDASAVINPARLAKHHLTSIVFAKGPMRIRYMVGELINSVPGFSRITPAKARRLIVVALNNRSGGKDVVFYKSGWGRWEAHFDGPAQSSAESSFEKAHRPNKV